ncbi:hypothetical protein PV797_15095 [Clostridiaceae bacterium M8S5]|nr:hypothetical protein PV797_15095 [Clostridiaceae bacterium M8S5]
MSDKEPKNIKNQSITSLAVPIAIGIFGGKAIGLGKVFSEITGMSKGFEKNANLLKHIKPYFSHSEQYTISKLQDIFDVLNKVGRIRGEQYETEVCSLDVELDVGEKKQRIIEALYDYLDYDKKQIIDKAMEVKEQIFTAKSKINGLNALDDVGINSTMDILFEFIKCFKPILSQEHTRNLDKFERAVEVLKSPD